MVKHALFHRRRNHDRGSSRKRDQPEQIVGEAERKSGDNRGRRRSDDQKVRVSCQTDVTHEVVAPRRERVSVYRTMGDRRERERLNKTLRGLRHDNVDVAPA